MAPKRPRPPAKPRNHGERKELEGSVRIGIEGRLGNLFGGRRPRVDAAQGRALPSGSPDLPVRGARLRRNRSRSGGRGARCCAQKCLCPVPSDPWLPSGLRLFQVFGTTWCHLISTLRQPELIYVEIK